MGKSTISMVIFNSYVKLPEGNGEVWVDSAFVNSYHQFGVDLSAECRTLVLPFGGFLLFSDLTLHLVHLLAFFIQLELLLHLTCCWWVAVIHQELRCSAGAPIVNPAPALCQWALDLLPGCRGICRPLMAIGHPRCHCASAGATGSRRVQLVQKPAAELATETSLLWLFHFLAKHSKLLMVQKWNNIYSPDVIGVNITQDLVAIWLETHQLSFSAPQGCRPCLSGEDRFQWSFPCQNPQLRSSDAQPWRLLNSPPGP